ncbi:MAG: hypothetical protein R3C56_05030 [Pirellulaceae bacterium]
MGPRPAISEQPSRHREFRWPHDQAHRHPQSFDGSTKTEGNRVQGRFKASTNKTTPTDTETISVNLDWDDSTWGVIGLQGVMMGHIPQPGELLHAQLFVPQLYKIAQAELLAGQPDLTALPGGQTQSLLAVDIILRSEDKGMLSRNWINERGEVLKTVALSGPNEYVLDANRNRPPNSGRIRSGRVAGYASVWPANRRSRRRGEWSTRSNANPPTERRYLAY